MGALAIASRKGGTTHRFVGNVFFVSMFVTYLGTNMHGVPAKPVKFAGNYPIGENVELLRVRAGKRVVGILG